MEEEKEPILTCHRDDAAYNQVKNRSNIKGVRTKLGKGNTNDTRHPYFNRSRDKSNRDHNNINVNNRKVNSKIKPNNNVNDHKNKPVRRRSPRSPNTKINYNENAHKDIAAQNFNNDNNHITRSRSLSLSLGCGTDTNVSNSPTFVGKHPLICKKSR